MTHRSDETILVLGATGTTGGQVARQLIAAGRRPRLLVRDLAKAREFEGGADLRQGSLENSQDLSAAMQGVTRLYLVSTGLDGPSLEILAVDAAKDAGVEHVVKLSVLTAEAPRMEIARWHARVEDHLRASNLAWTMLRPGNFHTNSLVLWAPSVIAEGVVYQPTGTGRWASIDPADVGAVAVKALTEDGHEGRSYDLTGSEAVDAEAYSHMIGEVLDRPISFVDVPIDSMRVQMAKFGMHGPYLDAAIDLLATMRSGRWDIVSDDLTAVTGRPPTSYRDWVKLNRAAFTAPPPA